MIAPPTYSFTLPSTHDDTPLDVRLFQPRGRVSRGAAVVAHPYAPLGGSQDDAVVEGVAEGILEQGFVVVTFNFRGAGHSAGKTSWTGRPEVDDYCSVVGFLAFYIQHLNAEEEGEQENMLQPIISIGPSSVAPSSSGSHGTAAMDLLLAGYSFGALILSRLPGVPAILERFETAEKGTAASEIFLRARTLGTQTRQATSPRTPRGRRLHSDDSSPHSHPHRRSSPVAMIVGGEETTASERRRSRDSRRSVEVLRDVPRNIKVHLHHHHHYYSRSSSDRHPNASAASALRLSVRYLLISPVLLPLTMTLLSPGLPFTAGSSGSGPEGGALSLQDPTLVVFGSADTFTSSRRLRQWAERLEGEAPDGRLQWTQIEGAGHFWREDGVMRKLRTEIQDWVRKGAGGA